MELAPLANCIDACDHCPVRARTICGAVELAIMRSLRRTTRTIKAGTDLLQQGGRTDSLNIVVDGWACLYELLEDGRRQILRFLLPGDLVGLAVDGGRASFGAQAITAVTVCVIPHNQFLRVMRQHPEFALALSQTLARQEALAYEHMTSLGRRNARERVARLLLELVCRVHSTSPIIPGDRIILPLTQQHVGDAVGLTPVHINRMLRGLREDGIIDLDRHTLRITDPDRLAAAAGFDRDVAIPGLPGSRRWLRKAPLRETSCREWRSVDQG